jgi:hypothetical protein
MARLDHPRRRPPRGARAFGDGGRGARARTGKTSYRDWFVPGGSLEDAIASMARTLESTPRVGLWIDTSHLTPEETVARIVADGMESSRYLPTPG